MGITRGLRSLLGTSTTGNVPTREEVREKFTTCGVHVLLQVSVLLTNHLSRAMDSLVVSETGASEGLQDALSLLLGLARSRMGRAILSQPACVSKLLLLLTDQRYICMFRLDFSHERALVSEWSVP